MKNLTYNDLVCDLARDRGRRGITFATADELRTEGYSEAWFKGRIDGIVSQIDGFLRWDGESLTAEDRQHRVNLALYAVAELRRLVAK